FFAVLGASLALAQQPAADPVVLTIGSEKITKSQFEQIISGLPDQQKTLAQSPAGKRRLAEQLSELKTLAQEARTRKMDQNPKIRSQIALATDQVLAQNLFQDLANSTPADDAALKAYYDQHKQEYDQVKARHILIRYKGSQVPLKPNQKDLTEEEALAKAKEIHDKIAAGGDFKKLAETESDDAGTAPNGGELGAFGKGRMVPQFEQAAFAAAPGKITDPVKSP